MIQILKLKDIIKVKHHPLFMLDIFNNKKDLFLVYNFGMKNITILASGKMIIIMVMVNFLYRIYKIMDNINMQDILKMVKEMGLECKDLILQYIRDDLKMINIMDLETQN